MIVKKEFGSNDEMYAVMELSDEEMFDSVGGKYVQGAQPKYKFGDVVYYTHPYPPAELGRGVIIESKLYNSGWAYRIYWEHYNYEREIAVALFIHESHLTPAEDRV